MVFSEIQDDVKHSDLMDNKKNSNIKVPEEYLIFPQNFKQFLFNFNNFEKKYNYS